MILWLVSSLEGGERKGNVWLCAPLAIRSIDLIIYGEQIEKYKEIVFKYRKPFDYVWLTRILQNLMSNR